MGLALVPKGGVGRRGVAWESSSMLELKNKDFFLSFPLLKTKTGLVHPQCQSLGFCVTELKSHIMFSEVRV